MKALSILKPRFDKLQLKGFQSAFFNADEDKFVAYSLLSVQDSAYDDLYNFFLSEKSCSYPTSEDETKYHNYNDDGSYSLKGKEQLVKEGIMKFASLRFYGVFYENNWFVLDEVSYHEENDVSAIKQGIEAQWFNEKTFSSGSFQPLPEYDQQIDFGKLHELASKKAGVQLGLADKEMFDYARELPQEEIPFRTTKQSVEYREYVGQPWLVGYLKQVEKSKVNRAFEIYINEAVFLPLMRRLKIEHPQDFSETQGLYSANYPLLYPHSKEYVIGIVKGYNEKEQSRLYYFLYLPALKQLFEWTKPKVKEVPGHHAEWILEDIKDLSNWGEDYSFHEPSVTMDDTMFWKEHVFKKEKDNFLYLRPVLVRI